MDAKPTTQVIKRTATRAIRNGNIGLALDLLTDDYLATSRDADLYGLKASALIKTDLDAAESAVIDGLAIDPNNVLCLYYKGMIANQKEDYNSSFIFFSELVSGYPDEPAFHQGLAVTQEKLGQPESIDSYNRAVELDPRNATIYNSRGVAYGKRGDYELAKSDFLKAIELAPYYNGPYTNLRVVFEKEEQFEAGVKQFDAIIQTQTKNGIANFNRAVLLVRLRRYKEAIPDIQTYLETATDGGYYKEKAVAMLAELPTLAKDENYRQIHRLVEKIRETLLFKGEQITHYTSLTVARLLVLKSSPFQISEGTFLNDASEGRELFEFLPPIVMDRPKDGDVVSVLFSSKPFIGSFVEAGKSNDLTLWRMYGKENKEEARGCALVFDRTRVLKTLRESLLGDPYQTDPDVDFLLGDEVEFFRVAYREPGIKTRFKIPGLSGAAIRDFNSTMQKLHAQISEMQSGGEISEDDRQTLVGIVNSISYLFKSSEYQYEQEVRLVMSGRGILKNIATGDFPRVYLNLFEVKPLMKGIIFGPKVEMAQEWAASFYYELEKAGLFPNIRVSKIPFK